MSQMTIWLSLIQNYNDNCSKKRKKHNYNKTNNFFYIFAYIYLKKLKKKHGGVVPFTPINRYGPDDRRPQYQTIDLIID